MKRARYIKNPSEPVQLNAITQNGYAIEDIESPSESVQLIAVAYDGEIIRLIKYPTLSVTWGALVSKPSIVFDPEFAVKFKPAILNTIHPGLASQIELIKFRSEDENERVAMLTVVLSVLAGSISTVVDNVELPLGLSL
jgi:hypothetical protein